MRILAFLILSMVMPAQAAFEVNSVIHPVVQKLEDPEILPQFSTIVMAVSTSSEQASDHVIQGMVRLNSPWDFEAYRHFCAAAKADPDCVMAYWGIAMSLAGRNYEFNDQRKAAVDRMLDLVEAGKGADIEHGFVEAAGRLYVDGANASGKLYQALAEKFPKNQQAKLLGLLLARDGFDTSGRPNPGQKRCMEGLQQMLVESPEDISTVSFWVTTQAEGPWNGASLRKDVLPFARKLARLYPDYPPFQLTAAHVEARCGNAKLAIEYCYRAIELYEAYMKKEKVTHYDCGGWIRAKVYLATLWATKGEYEKALPIVDELSKMKVDEERVFSRGASLLLWEGRSLGARLAMSRSSKKDYDRALKTLEALPKEQWFLEKSLSGGYRDALVVCLSMRNALLKKDLKAAKELYRSLIQRVQAIDATKELASKTNSYSDWVRARAAVTVLTVELRGMMSMEETGAMKMQAVNWFKSAADRQGKALNLLPPAVPYPMENRLGAYYLGADNAESAVKAYRKGLERMPNHLGALQGYQAALLKLGKKEAADQIAKRIEMVKE